MVEEFLSSETLLTEKITYIGDEDGNIRIIQDGGYITMTPKQCLDMKELLSAHLDVLNMKIARGN